MPDTANTPNVLTRTPAAFAALEEVSTELLNPAYIEALFSTLGQRHHGQLLGKFLQRFMAEVQAALVGGTTPGPVTPALATVTTTNTDVTELASVAVADSSCVSIEAEIWGKKAIGDWVHMRMRYQYERADSGNGLQLLDVESDTGPRYSVDATLTTADAAMVIDGNTIDIRVTGEASTIVWSTLYTVKVIS